MESKKRVDNFFKDIAPVLKYFQQRNLLTKIDGSKLGLRTNIYRDFNPVDVFVYEQFTRVLSLQPIPLQSMSKSQVTSIKNNQQSSSITADVIASKHRKRYDKNISRRKQRQAAKRYQDGEKIRFHCATPEKNNKNS